MGAYLAVQRWESHLARESFERVALEALHHTRTEVSYALDALDAIAAFIRSSQAIEPAEFRDYTDRLLKRRAVAALAIAERRGPRYPVVHLEPQAQFPELLGSDLASMAEARAALTSAGAALSLLENPGLGGDLDPRRTYLALMSARGSGPADIAAEPDSLPIVIGVLDMNELAISSVPEDGALVHVQIEPQAPAIGSTMRAGSRRVAEPRVGEFRYVRDLSVGGLDFILVASSPAVLWSVGGWWIRWAGLLLGLGMTSLVAAYLHAAGARSRLLQNRMETSEQRFQRAFQVANHGMALVAPDGRWLQVNSALCEMLGYSARELEVMDFQSVTHSDDLPADLAALDRLLRGEIASYEAEQRYLHRDGHPLWVDLSVAPVSSSDGSVAHFVWHVIDLTRRKQAEAQLLQAQKMESIGQLTGGIAHDFNNLLMVVQGNLELAQLRAGENERLAAILRTARGAAERGATLTKQLLAFARRQPLEAKTVDLSASLAELERLIRSTIGEAVNLGFDCPPDLWSVRVDPVKLETALLNLVVNARDAIGGDGTISIRARNQSVDSSYARMEGIDAGDYVFLSVSDDGSGIPAQLVDKVVEPFFTTKGVGKGSGLGLSMVYGFMKQSRGHLKIYSEEGTGTNVKLYLPRVRSERTADPAQVTPEPIPMAREGETILVVEDQAHVRELAMDFLEELGYSVVDAESGKGALQVLEQDERIALVLSDVVMPGGLDGFELASAMADRFPAIPVVLMSGYPGQPSGEEGAGGHEILLKPFSLVSLGRRVRRTLDGAARRNEGGDDPGHRR